MIRPFRRLGRALLAFAVLGFACHVPASAQADPARGYPDRPITLLIPFAAGGATDVLARLVAEKLRERLGQPVIVVNRPGAGGEIAVDQVRRAPADGYTLLVTSSNFAVAPFVSKEVSRSTLDDFTHIIALAEVPWLLVVNEKVPARTAAEFIAHARANPGRLNWGLVGAEDFEVELFLREARLDIEKIRYAGTAPLMLALLSDEVQAVFTSIRAVQAHIDSGKLRGLAVSTLKRSPQTPDIPALSEAAIPGYDGSSIWFGISGQAGMPKAIAERLNRELQAVLAMPDVVERINGIKFRVMSGTQADFRTYIARDIARMQEIAAGSSPRPQ